MYSLVFLSSVLGASALSLPRSSASCPFTLTATGGQTGTIGSLGDGQTRIGGGYAPTTFTINSSNGTVTDDAGRACILTPAVDQFQCDLNGVPTAGFAISSNGSFTASGSSVFYACPASDTEWNLYTQPVQNQAKCVEVGLTASDCYSAVSSSSAVASSTAAASSSVVVASSPAPSVVTVTAATPAPSTVTVTVSNCGSAPSAPAAVESSAPAVAASSVPVAAASSPVAAASSPVAAVSSPAAAVSTPVAAASTPVAAASTPAVVVVKSSAPAPVAPTTLATSVAPAKSSPAFTYSWANYTTTAVVSTAIPSATESASSCVATSLTGSSTSGNYQYPHLIVPVASTSPNTAYGTQYFATISSNTSTIFNFDVPSSYAGKTCNLIFLLPEHDQLETSSYTSSGTGEIEFTQLSGVATSGTTYNNQPSVAKDLGEFDITVGSSTLIESFACPAGQTVSYELSAVGNTYLNYFQDWNPSPLGLYITYC